MHTYSYLLLLQLQILLAVNTNSAFPSINNVASVEVCRYESKDSSARMQAIEGEEVLEVYSNEWLVGIPGGPKIAGEIAEKLGFVNKGLVSIYSLSLCIFPI